MLLETPDIEETIEHWALARLEKLAAEAEEVASGFYLRAAQERHWRDLFSGRFDDHYARRTIAVSLGHARAMSLKSLPAWLRTTWSRLPFAKLRHRSSTRLKA